MPVLAGAGPRCFRRPPNNRQVPQDSLRSAANQSAQLRLNGSTAMSHTEMVEAIPQESCVTASTRVLILDPFPCSGFGLQALSAWTEGVEVVQVDESPANLADRLDEHLPDVLLVDSSFCEQALALLCTRRLMTKLVLWDLPPRAWKLEELLHAGVGAVLSRRMAVPDILAALRLVSAGQAVLSNEAMARIAEDSASSVLSEIEIRVLALMGDGLDNEAIAASVHVSESTVKRQVAAVLNKLRVSNRMQAVALAARSGLI